MATNTASSSTTHTGNGSTTAFAISFSFLSDSEIDVTVAGVLKTITTHYTISGSTLTFTGGNTPADGAAIKFQRDTDISAKKVDFQDGSVLTEIDLDTNADQVLFAQQEIIDKLVGIEEGATGDQTNAEIKTAYEANSDTNAFTDALQTKLNAIEASATADQTNAEIRTAVEAATDSNVFTDADHTKLNGIEASATADQTDAEIKTAYENNSNTNAFTDAEKTKLTNIEASATADQTAAEIRTLVESASDSNVFTDADHSKLNAIEASATADQTDAEIRTAVEAATDSNVFTDADHTKLNAIEASATADQTGAEIKSAYEGESNTNAFTDAEKTKLSGIETSADVTDATNVDAAGAVMNSDLDTKGELLVGDGSGDPSALSVGTNGYILTADSSEATGIKWAANAGSGGGSAIGNVVEDTTPQLGGNLDVQASEITTSTTNGNIKLNPNGTGVVEVKGDGSSADGTLQLNCSQNSHGVKIKSPAHSAGASYTLTLPINVVNGQFLKTDTNGVLSWAAVDLTALSATNLTSGTVPDARFPATLPAASAANLTSIPAGNLTGTVADARISALTASKLTGALPAISAANLTSIPAANITGTLPAIDGSALTGVASTTGGGAIYENSATISASRTIPSGSNGMSAGPITVASGQTLTVSSGSVYTIV